MSAPTAYEQLILELINRARLDPNAEASRLGISLNKDLSPGQISGDSKQPLAYNSTLNNAAAGHSNWMLANNVFSHTGAGGSDPGDRMAAAGYQFSGNWTWGENIAWNGTTGTLNVLQAAHSAHDGLFDSAGHRLNILNDNFKEIGVGAETGNYRGYNAFMLTENFAKSGSGSFITGVAYNDNNGDSFYSIGEGRGGVNVSFREGSSGLGSTSTWSAGGYALKTTETGNITVTFSGGGLPAAVTATVVLANENVKVDLIGTTRIESSVTTTLGQNARTLELLGTDDIDGTGNELSNTIIGNAGDNFLSTGGGTGHDVLRGMAGNDKYRVYSSQDSVIESANNGTDRVYASADFRLDNGSSVEILTTHSSKGSKNIDLTGNHLSQTVVGNAGDNYLSTGNGAPDTLRGLSGNDRYRVYNQDDLVIETANGGTDRIYTSVDYQLAHSTEIEWLTTHASSSTSDLRLTGNALSQTINGNAGDNYISAGGKGGADVLRGLGGNDVYRVYNPADTIIEASGAGYDRVIASTDFGLDQGVSVEWLTTNSSRGTASIDLTGNEQAQLIYGNAGNNYLSSGGKGQGDILRGLGGNDKYRVYNPDDVVVETSGGGNDRVYSSIDYVLASDAHVEQLTTNSSSRTSSIDLTGNNQSQLIAGNAGNNILTGKGGADTLKGLSGNDTLIGGSGNDTHTGGSGADTFIFNSNLEGVDQILDFTSGEDTLRLLSDGFNSELPTGNLSPTDFVNGTNPTANHGQLLYNQSTGQLAWDADGTGGQSADIFVELQDGALLTYDDFLIV